ncbi:MAG TPA: ferredoxin [Bacteroides sp.]|nr:ferredoxin [Bacteroides sp.]
MAIVKVWITDDCTACNLCVDTCPEVFELPDDIAEVIEGADFSEYEDEIIEAAESCPVEAIQYEEEED